MAQGKAYTKEEKEEVIRSLKKYFLLGYSITKACEYAGFPYQRVYEWVKEDVGLRSKIGAWQGQINAKAREVIAHSILGDEKEGIKPDLRTAQWWAERMEREDFSTRTENDITTKGEPITGFQFEIIDKTEDIENDSEDTGDTSIQETPESGE